MSHQLLQIREPVSLRQLFPSSSFVGCADIRVNDATERSEACGPNTLFAAIPGTRVDGAHFVSEAIERGAASLLVQRPEPTASVPQCVVPDVRRAFSVLCSALSGFPSRQLTVAAVTGTNGKTTVTWLIRSILQAAGKRTGLLGTIEYHDGMTASPSELTTPDAKTLVSWMSNMVRRGTTHAAMEVSSHALDQNRVAGTQFNTAVITNITQDHFDYHLNFESYLNCKAKILEHCKPGATVVVNSDDRGSSQIAARADESVKVVSFGFDRMADFSATVLDESLAGSRFILHNRETDIPVSTVLVGRHNIANCLAAAAAVWNLGVTANDIQSGIDNLTSVPGRMERVDCGQPFDVFIDYAHTEDALTRALRSLRNAVSGRLICVFGAGGDRDRSKRPLLGNAASAADLAVVTSDNPRSEQPEQIIDDILSGIDPMSPRPHVETDRSEAIRWSLEQAEPGDCVLVAGKGHESYQIIGNKRIRFVDREVVEECLSNLVKSSHTNSARMSA